MIAKFNIGKREITLPVKYAICPECEGVGTELGHGLKGLALSGDALEDSDFMQDYFNGAFDVPCSCCKGRTTVTVMDVNGMTFAQKRLAVEVRRIEREQREIEAEREYRRNLRESGIEY